MNVVFKELKQRITAIVAIVRRYKGWVDSYRQNRLFENNQRQFYRVLAQEEERCDDLPVAEELKQFWGNIWSQSADHKKDANWLQDLRSEVIVKKQEKIDITTGSLKKILGRMPNWKSPGPNLVQGFWFKLLSAIFYQFFIFSPSDSPSKTMKMFFISSKKLFLFMRYSSFCDFFPCFPHFPDSKGQMEVG